MRTVTEAVDGGSRSYHHGDLRSALVGAAVARVEEVGAENLSLRAVAEDMPPKVPQQ